MLLNISKVFAVGAAAVAIPFVVGTDMLGWTFGGLVTAFGTKKVSDEFLQKMAESSYNQKQGLDKAFNNALEYGNVMATKAHKEQHPAGSPPAAYMIVKSISPTDTSPTYLYVGIYQSIGECKKSLGKQLNLHVNPNNSEAIRQFLAVPLTKAGTPQAQPPVSTSCYEGGCYCFQMIEPGTTNNSTKSTLESYGLQHSK